MSFPEHDLWEVQEENILTIAWQRIDPLGPGLHSPKLDGDVGYDLECEETIKLNPGEEIDVGTNVRVKLPPGCWAEIRARSSIAKRGLQVAATVIDNGYTGPLFVLLRNVSRRDGGQTDWIGRVTVEKGERIAQLVLHRGVYAMAVECEFDDDPRRGTRGFGSTNQGKR